MRFILGIIATVAVIGCATIKHDASWFSQHVACGIQEGGNTASIYCHGIDGGSGEVLVSFPLN